MSGEDVEGTLKSPNNVISKSGHSSEILIIIIFNVQN